MAEVIFTSILAFVSTNLDDIFILMLFFGSKRYTSRDIFLGQYIGISSLVVISFILSLAGYIIDQRYIGFLGLFPVYLAIKQFIQLLKPDAEDEPKIDFSKTGMLAVAGVTIANGADNIGVYVPLFATQQNYEIVFTTIVFMIMTYVWCFLGGYLAKHPLLSKPIDRFGHLVMPVVLLMLGVYILYESKVITLFD